MSADDLELWAGVECTVNRVRGSFRDQVRDTGHHDRIDDLDRIAALGARAIRYPILWERTAPRGLSTADFSWADARMERIRELGMRPIVGLVHHGSGPASTSLLSPDFAEGLAEFASLVAERYPWVRDFTPVNEPLTTARFSALYGHWYPHRRDAGSLLRALLVQTRATAMAMRAIRTHIADARLVQTEDVGTVTATGSLGYQAAYENQRRWLSLDLLFGRVTPSHPLYRHIVALGATESELRALVEEATPPDLVGVNYYVTSDRHLDERVALYPPTTHGGNGRHRYADVEAVRVRGAGIVGHERVLREVAARYEVPVAITEAHLGCAPEEQIRWLWEAWRGASAAREAGADVRAVTLWSVFGAFDWNSLVTRSDGHYEPGAFDVRGPAPRPTAIARVARELTRDGRSTHPLVALPGWWRRAERFFHSVDGVDPSPATSARPIVVTGAGGTLGAAIVRACEARGLAVTALSHSELDVSDERALSRALAERDPWLVINAAGSSRVHEAEDEPDACRRANTVGPSLVAATCRRHGARLMVFSSAFVFDGGKDDAYLEDDPVRPINAYGACQAAAEREVLRVLPEALVIRAGALFGPDEERSFVAGALRAARAERAFAAPEDRFVSLAYLPHLADACLDLAVDHAEGIWHLANHGVASFAAWARTLCEAARLPSRYVIARPAESLALRARLPRRAALGSARRAALPPIEEALRCFAERRAV